jgi:hypothetical protein
LRRQLEAVSDQDVFEVFDLIGLVGVIHELVVTVQVEEGVADYFDLIVFVNVGAYGVKVFVGPNRSLDTLLHFFKVRVKGILLSDLAEVIQGLDVAAAGGLLVGSRGLDGVTGNIDKDILRDIYREINPEGNFRAKENELVLEFFGRIFNSI